MFQLGMELIRPTLDRLEGYRAGAIRSLEEGMESSPEYLADQLQRMTEDPAKFVESQEDPDALAGDVPLPNGDTVPRLPGFTRWIWDGEVCGTINFRWSKGTTELPDYCLGHIGYGVFAWKRGHGYATRSLGLMLEEVRPLGLPFVELVTDPDNLISQKVIAKNGGVLHETYTLPEVRGGGLAMRYRIYFEK